MFNYSCNKAEKESPAFGKYRFKFNLRHLRLRRRFAVPDKIIGLTLVLDFFRPLHPNACPASATGSGQAFCPKQAIYQTEPHPERLFVHAVYREQWDYTTYLKKKQSKKEEKVKEYTGPMPIWMIQHINPLTFSMQFHIYLQSAIAPIGKI